MKKVMALFASGTGSNAFALWEKSQELSSLCQITTLVCDQPEAPVLKLFAPTPVECLVFSAQGLEPRQHEANILAAVLERKIQWIFLAGYMRILSGHFIQSFYDQELQLPRILNIHPSWLPQFPGKNAYQRAFASGANSHGVTVHVVDEGVDTGPVVAQESFERRPSDHLQDFIERGKGVEHMLYPRVLEQIVRGHWP